jgi:hypothetical protein
MPRFTYCSTFAAATLFVASLCTVAHARPDTRAMTCEQTRAFIDDAGAVVLTTGPNTYDRYVRSSAQCSFTERAELDFVKTSDDMSCPVRRCESVELPFEPRR